VTALGEVTRAVARAVIGHHRGDPDAEAAQRLHGALQKAGGGTARLIGQDLAEGYARGVVNGHMAKLPTGASNRVTAITADPMPGPDDSPELFDVQVQQLAGHRPLVPARQRGYLQQMQPRPAAAAHDPRHGRTTDPHRPGDLRAGTVLLTQDLDAQGDRGGRGPGAMMRARGAIGKGVIVRTAARPVHPLADRALRHVKVARDAAGRAAHPQHLPGNFPSTSRRQTGILMDVHPGLLWGCR
jgi:hypothetical protein